MPDELDADNLYRADAAAADMVETSATCVPSARAAAEHKQGASRAYELAASAENAKRPVQMNRAFTEREKGFEPSTSTLARGSRPRDPRRFATLKEQNGAARSTLVV